MVGCRKRLTADVTFPTATCVITMPRLTAHVIEYVEYVIQPLTTHVMQPLQSTGCASCFPP